MICELPLVQPETAPNVRAACSPRRIDARSRQLAAPIVALLLVMTAALFKGPYLDLDPLNVYFWLFAGMALAVAARTSDEARVPAEVPQ